MPALLARGRNDAAQAREENRGRVPVLPAGDGYGAVLDGKVRKARNDATGGMHLAKDVGEHKTQPDRPAVVITREMMEAGARVILDHFGFECAISCSGAQRIAREIFLEMTKAEPLMMAAAR